MLRTICEQGKSLSISHPFTNVRSKLGLPDTQGLCIPVNFHKRATFEVGYGNPLQDNIGFVLIGNDTPEEVKETCVEHALPGAIVVYEDGVSFKRALTPFARHSSLVAGLLL